VKAVIQALKAPGEAAWRWTAGRLSEVQVLSCTIILQLDPTSVFRVHETHRLSDKLVCFSRFAIQWKASSEGRLR
jgi:hypothetical protein